MKTLLGLHAILKFITAHVEIIFFMLCHRVEVALFLFYRIYLGKGVNNIEAKKVNNIDQNLGPISFRLHL